MSKTMQDEIDLEVERFSPSKDMAIGMLSRNEMIQLIRKCVTAGAFVGWCHAETMTRERMQRKLDQLEYEMKCIKECLKEVEMELLASNK